MKALLRSGERGDSLRDSNGPLYWSKSWFSLLVEGAGVERFDMSL